MYNGEIICDLEDDISIKEIDKFVETNKQSINSFWIPVIINLIKHLLAFNIILNIIF